MAANPIRKLYANFADVSACQSQVDFAAMKAGGIECVALKAGNGAGGIAADFPGRLAAAKAAGLLVGAYLFGTGHNPVSEQVGNLSAALGEDQTIVPILDFESNPSGSTMSQGQAEEFATLWQSQRGYYPVLYGGESAAYLLLLISPNSPLLKCPLWVAKYPSTTADVRTLDADQVLRRVINWPGGVIGWQYEGGEPGQPTPSQCPGVPGKCDRSVTFSTGDDLKAQWRALTMGA